jgi:hypothetical protein
VPSRAVMVTGSHTPSGILASDLKPDAVLIAERSSHRRRRAGWYLVVFARGPSLA